MGVLGIKKYVKDFRPGEQGYEYTGAWQRLLLTAKERKTWIVGCEAELLLLSFLYILGMTGKNAGSYVFWILLPYISLFLPLMYGWMGILSVRRLKQQNPGEEERTGRKGEYRMRRMDYDRGIRRLQRCGTGMVLLSVIVTVFDVLLLMGRMGEVQIRDEILFLGVSIGFSVISVCFLLQNQKIRKKVEKIAEKIEKDNRN